MIVRIVLNYQKAYKIITASLMMFKMNKRHYMWINVYFSIDFTLIKNCMLILAYDMHISKIIIKVNLNELDICNVHANHFYESNYVVHYAT